MMMRAAFIALLADAASALEGDDIFDGSAVVAAAGTSVSAADARYPRKLELDLPHKSPTLRLRLKANTALFSPEWFAAEWNGEGELVETTTDPENYMCHYLGSVDGMPDSFVALSVCDDIGIQGRILGPDLELGVRATDSSLRSVANVGEHVIYNVSSAMMGVAFEEPVMQEDLLESPNGARQDAGELYSSFSRYLNSAVFVSSLERLHQFSSNSHLVKGKIEW
jgi:hypothetical protein